MAIWKQVLEQLGDMTADFASYYDHVAISAPDSLVVHFREGYTLQKESCEQPDRKAQLEQTMARIVGRHDPHRHGGHSGAHSSTRGTTRRRCSS